MTNKLLLLLILSVTFFSACSDDDNEDKSFVGKWNVPAVQLNGEEYVSGPLTLSISSSDAEMNETLAGLIPWGEKMANTALVQVLQDVTFQKNGQIIATYRDSASAEWQVSAEKYLTYKVVSGTRMKLHLNLTNILAEANIDLSAMTGQLDSTDVATLMAFMTKITTEGITVDYLLSVNADKLSITLNKAVVDEIIHLVPILAKLIPATGDLAVIAQILPQMPTLWTKIDTFSATLNLER